MRKKQIQNLFIAGVGLLLSVSAVSAGDKLVYPLQTVSKLECRFQEYDTLTSDCKTTLPVLTSKNYKKYSTMNKGYNEFTRFYTVLWGGSYKYGWDIGHGGHQGTDIATAKGTPVHAITNGKVIVSDKTAGWGQVISIEHTVNGKKVISNYAHLSKRLVSKGDTVRTSDIIGEVGSTGNSTGNHLHFQIDLPGAPFYPYYYDYNECPFSYYQITEEGKCFDVLAKHTLDPLKFLETNGAILENYKTSKPGKIDLDKTNDNSDEDNASEKDNEEEINIKNIELFNKYIHPDSPSSDVKDLQKFLTDIGYYNGEINGVYSDIMPIITRYQLTTGVINDANDDGSGYFGPKTRAQAKKDYTVFLESGKRPTLVSLKDTIKHNTSDGKKEEVENIPKVEKISKENLMTREEMEKKEREEFLEDFKFSIIEELDLNNIVKGEKSQFLLKVSNNFDKPFVGSTPGNLTFQYDESKIDVFPNEFFYFDNGQREIYIKGKTEGKTRLSILIADEVVKSFDVVVRPQNQVSRQPESAKIYMTPDAAIGDTKKGLIVLKDEFNKNIIGTKYPGSFRLEDNSDVEYCIKRGDLKDYKKIFSSTCKDSEYVDHLNFKYSDSVGGLLMFDYRVKNQDSEISFNLKTDRKQFASKVITGVAPKGLATQYPYYDNVITTLESGITSGAMEGGYFGQDDELTKQLASSWLMNAVLSSDTISKADKNAKVQALLAYKNDTSPITRKEFFELTNTVMPQKKSGSPKDYVDADEYIKKLAVTIFGSDHSWKDKFGNDYFRPDAALTKGEGTYVLTLAFESALPQLVRK